jgi:hypothetical protein
MLLKIKLFVKKIFFGSSLFFCYFFDRRTTLIKTFSILGQRNIYESKLLLSIIDKLFIHTKQFSYQGTNSATEIVDNSHIIICLTGLLDPKKKSNSWLFYEWAKNYLEANSQNRVTFFVTNEHVYLKEFLKNEPSIVNEYFEDFKNLKYKTNDSRFNYQVIKTSSNDLAVNIQKACEQILDLNPTHLVFFSGWNCDSPLVRKTLFNFKPIIYHITQGTHQIPSFAHLMIVSRGKKVWYIKRNLPVMDVDNYYLRKKENIPLKLYENIEIVHKFKENDEAVVIATILGGKRILNGLSRYSRKELNIFIDFIENNNVVWYLIGVDNENALRGLSKELNVLIERNKIVVLKFKTSIDEFLVDVDIYCHLPLFVGGGGIASMALRNKTVLICDSYSDVARRLEDQYIFDDFKVFFKNLEELTNSVEKRLETMVSQNLYLNKYSEKEVNCKTKIKLENARTIFNSYTQS